MKKISFLTYILLSFLILDGHEARAQNTSSNALHVIKSSINAEADNAEFCLEFDHTLTQTSPYHLTIALHLEQDGKKVVPQNIEATGASICIFPLDRDKPYHIEVNGLRGEDVSGGDVKMITPYTLSFTIPDRSPSLAFARKKYGNSFGSYDSPLVLRAVNVGHVKLTAYHLTDIPVIARAWQDRAEAALAPSESVYLAKNKGQQIWQSENDIPSTSNIMSEQTLVLQDQIPNLTPGLYLIVADAGKESDSSPANKGLAPLAATWFMKSDFSLRAIHDEGGIHIFSSKPDPGIHLVALNKKQEKIVEAQNGPDGTAFISFPLKSGDQNDIATIIGIDGAGNTAATDNDALPSVSKLQTLGVIRQHNLFVTPGETVDLSLAASENMARIPDQSALRILRNDSFYTDITVPAPVGDSAKLSFAAPLVQNDWKMHWQKNDGTLLAETSLRVTSNPEAPHLEVNSDRDFLTSDAAWPITIKSLTNAGKPTALTGGTIVFAWQNMDPATLGWKDYHFGIPNSSLNAPIKMMPFLTDLQGTTSLRLSVPPAPSDPGLYQAALSILAEPDAGVDAAKTLVLPLHPDTSVIGIKPLTINARFPQNGIARFALLALSSEGKPRDLSSLSYQIYEEGRSFDWYQDDGRWKYKPEPHLRPIGGGALAIKADGTSILDWPVTAGNYRLEILESGGKKLAETDFSAGWDALMPVPSTLTIGLPKILQPGKEAVAHVTLPEAATLTVIIADQHIRKIIHERQEKGDHEIAFTPASDWQKTINVMIDATPQDRSNLPLHGIAEASITENISPPHTLETNASIVSAYSPSATLLRKENRTTLLFGIENLSDNEETYNYRFATSAGLKIESGEKGIVTLAGRQSRVISLGLVAEQAGIKELQMDLNGTHTPHLNSNWMMTVLPKEDGMRSLETYSVNNQDIVFKKHAPESATMAFVARHSMDGVPELLTFVFNSHPFTTRELAFGIDFLRSWGDILVQAGLISDVLVKAQQQSWLMQLLSYQNDDGGFPDLSQGESTMDGTSSALIALGPDLSEQATPAKNLAIEWLKQRLSNTWFDDKERLSRAAAYAGLAAADAIDVANLHYFSDTSATQILPPIAEANIAAAFKHIHDPNAAAFWIKKMLDEKGDVKTIPVLNSLAATDALSSDDVHTTLSNIVSAMREGNTPSLLDAMSILRALAADNRDAGKWRISAGKEIRTLSDVFIVHPLDSNLLSYTNAGPSSLSLTYATFGLSSPPKPPHKSTLTRHIYRLNGVELSGSSQPTRGEIYLVEIKGALPQINDGEHILLQDGNNSDLRPISCSLSEKLNVTTFLPWLTLQDSASSPECKRLAHTLSLILNPKEDGNFRVLYFSYIDAPSLTAIEPPQIRILQ
jgi:uncharacterized protein YfaS (alpha-2-macroglobulin family)